jgi:hypothetical protein
MAIIRCFFAKTVSLCSISHYFSRKATPDDGYIQQKHVVKEKKKKICKLRCGWKYNLRKIYSCNGMLKYIIISFMNFKERHWLFYELHYGEYSNIKKNYNFACASVRV